MVVAKRENDSGSGDGWHAKGKGKRLVKGACHGCGEIGHRVAECSNNDPKKRAVNQVGEAPEDYHSREDEEHFENGGWGYLAAIEACRTPPGLTVPTKNRWDILKPDDDDCYEPNDETIFTPSSSAQPIPPLTAHGPVKRGKKKVYA